MTSHTLVAPEQIEAELLNIWEGLAKKNKMRASLFNLIVFCHLSSRTDYIRTIVQRVVEKFPCRILFISQDENSAHDYLKTAVSVVMPGEREGTFACDLIDVGVAGSDWKKIPLLILPHILPDLPVYLLWAEDPSVDHPLFDPLQTLATRVIFDSESSEHLCAFAEKLLKLHAERDVDIADLNWARIEGWRHLFTSTFDTQSRIEELLQISSFSLAFNAKETEFFCHLKIQALYLLGWLSSRLQWKLLSSHDSMRFTFQKDRRDIEVALRSQHHEELGPGAILSCDVLAGNTSFVATRLPQQQHRVQIHIASQEKCELPYSFFLGQTATGQSLVQEITTKGTSVHYLDMLKTLTQFDLEMRGYCR